MQIKYIADDGKEFDNEWDCRNYEEELWLKQCNPAEDIFMFDENFVRIDIHDMQSFYSAFDNSWFVCVKTEIAREKVNTLCKEAGCEEIPAINVCYKYIDKGAGQWQDYMFELMHERDEINTQIDMVNAIIRDKLHVLLAGMIGGVCLYEFDGRYEVYEGDHYTIFDNKEDAMAYYCSVGGYLSNED